MGLLDGLGDMLKGLLGQADQAGGLPAVINNILGQTQYKDLNGLVAALQKGGLMPRCNRGLGRAQTCRSVKTS